MICTEITPTKCFHVSFQIACAWYAATYSWRICD
jgi:hypothetical protein